MFPEESSSTPPAKSPKHRFQFSLLTLLSLMTAVALASAIYVSWNPIGRAITLVGVAALFVAVRLAIHLRIGQERADP
jgi:hypothetical protein